MAQIQSGATADLLTIDPTSKAARVTLYGPDGQALAYNSGIDRGIVAVNVVASATTAAASVLWALRSATSGKVLYVTKVWLQPYFVGTGAATIAIYELIKGATCTSMSGGSTITPLLKRTSITNGDVDARVLDTGLTLTGVAYGTQFYRVAWPRLTPSATQAGPCGPLYTLDFGQFPLELAQNEVLAIRLVNTAVVNDGLIGGVEFNGG